MQVGFGATAWALIVFMSTAPWCYGIALRSAPACDLSLCTAAGSLLGRSRVAAEQPEEADDPAGEIIVIPPECTAGAALAQKGSMQRAQQVPIGPAPAAAPVAAPAVVAVAVAPAVAPPPAPPPTDCKEMFKKEAKLKKKEKEEAEKKIKKECKKACKAADKLRKKSEKEAEDAAKKGGKVIKEQVKRIKESTAKAVKAEVKAVTAAIKEAGKSAREELKTAVEEDLASKNETAREAIGGLGKEILEEDREMFGHAKEHENNLAEEVQKLVWDEGMVSAYHSTLELTAKSGERAHNISKDVVVPTWLQSLHDAEHAKNVSYDSLHSILTMWQSALTSSHQEWSKVSAAFDSANIAMKLSHDTVAHVLSGVELSTLLRDTATFYKLDAKEAYDRSAALLSKAQEDLRLTQKNAQLIAGLEQSTDDAAGAANRAIDAAKKVSVEIKKKYKI